MWKAFNLAMFKKDCQKYFQLQREARYRFHQTKIFDEFVTLFRHFRKEPRHQSGRRQSRLICGGKRVSKYLRCLSPRGMKFQVKVEYGKDKFVKFYVEADVVDGIVLNYSFSSLVEDIRRTCGSLRHHTSSTLRVRYKDEDGDFVNLNEEDTDNFQEMFVRASSVDEGLYRKIILRVSELDSPVVQPLGLARKRKIEDISSSARDTEHKLDPRSLERSFACAATSTVKPERSPLDHVKTELAENVQLKKYCYRVRRRNYAKPLAKMMPSPLTQLFAQGSVEIVMNLDIQDRDVIHLPALPMTLVV